MVKATKTIAAGLAMKNDFPVFMSVMDVAWFRPDLIDPASPVPTGIGAVAYLDILQRHLGLATHEEAAKKMIELQVASRMPKAKMKRYNSLMNDVQIAGNPLAGGEAGLPADRRGVPVVRVPQVLQLRQRHQEVRGKERLQTGKVPHADLRRRAE